MGKCHDGIADELELGLELGILSGQTLLTRAHLTITLIVRGAQAARVTTFKMVFPKF